MNLQDAYICPLHVQLGLLKILVKALDREGHAFAYLRNKFPNLSEAEVEEGIFIGPQIWEVI
jgi:hypothetical protein